MTQFSVSYSIIPIFRFSTSNYEISPEAYPSLTQPYDVIRATCTVHLFIVRVLTSRKLRWEDYVARLRTSIGQGTSWKTTS